MNLKHFLFSSLLLSAIHYADPAPAPPITFPKKTKPDVQPAPLPDAPYVLTGDALYVIDCKVDCVLRAHPANLVAVKKLTGPVTVYSKFSDGSGKLEMRTFAGPTVFVVTATGTGTVNLDVIPVGFKNDSEIQTATVQVDSGQAPQPPPGPGPKPPDPAPVVVKTFRVILISETANNLTPEQRAVLDGVTVENFLNATCTGGKNGWRRRDKDQAGDADPTMAAMWNATKPKITTVPCVAVGVNDKVDIIPLEATPEAMVAVLKKYAEGK